MIPETGQSGFEREDRRSRWELQSAGPSAHVRSRVSGTIPLTSCGCANGHRVDVSSSVLSAAGGGVWRLSVVPYGVDQDPALIHLARRRAVSRALSTSLASLSQRLVLGRRLRRFTYDLLARRRGPRRNFLTPVPLIRLHEQLASQRWYVRFLIVGSYMGQRSLHVASVRFTLERAPPRAVGSGAGRLSPCRAGRHRGLEPGPTPLLPNKRDAADPHGASVRNRVACCGAAPRPRGLRRLASSGYSWYKLQQAWGQLMRQVR